MIARSGGGGLRAREIMTSDTIAVRVSDSFQELARTLLGNDISGVPVVDAQQRVIGVASKTDLLQWCLAGGTGLGPDVLLEQLADEPFEAKLAELPPDRLGRVEDFMSTDPLTCSPDDSVGTVARRMAEQRVHRIIVVDRQGVLQGVITSLDLLKAFPQDDEVAERATERDLPHNAGREAEDAERSALS